MSYYDSYWRIREKASVMYNASKIDKLHGSVSTFCCLQVPLDQARDLLPAASSDIMTACFFTSCHIVKMMSTS